MVKAHPLNNPHSAGIFADMSIDGPEIGTLVLIVDRAKNLPNRKTIGKQDPYCAARLGKEAKKTTTDIRGGQTPKWDQEIRFTVHDSPDYYQLKLSVFNDDKKTELIGEAWIDLRDIVIPGGGQNDLWQNLTCKGKYAGEIRIEITYYDTRPKPEKPPAKPKPVASDTDSPAGSMKMPKRRPLPSDPFTGQAPAQPPQPAPSHAPAPPRPQPTPPSDYGVDHPAPDHIQPAPRVVQPNPPYPASHALAQSAQYSAPPSVRHRQQHDHYSAAPAGSYHPPPPRLEPTHGSVDRQDRYSPYPDDSAYSPDHQGHTPDRRYVQSTHYASTHDLSLGERPPPPPAHRTTPTGTPEARYSLGRDVMHQNQTPPVMRRDVLRSEAHRQSVPSNAYPGRPVYRAYDSAPAANNEPYMIEPHQSTPPRHHSYDPAYEAHYRSLQPTVEDVPEDDHRRSIPRAPQYTESDYLQGPNPASLSLRGGRNSAPIVHYGEPASNRDYGRGEVALSTRDHQSASHTAYDSYSRDPQPPYPTSGDQDVTRYEMPAVPTSLIPGMEPSMTELSHRINEDRRHERRHTQPAAHNTPVGSMRGRQMIEPPPSYSAPPPEASQQFTLPNYNGESHDNNYSGSASSQQIVLRRGNSPGHSPSGQHTIRRKSVSPAPAPAPPEARRLSAIPFGPDDYNALNPSLAAPLPKDQVRQEKEYDEIGGKIITHDGKEVDPSDHLPMDTWAPEPEHKGARKSSDGSSRPSLSGSQAVPQPGRKALRIRPASSIPPSTYISPDMNRNSLPPPGTGRNRLQKKANRSSAMPAMMSGANGPGPGPLASLPQERDTFVPRPMARASTVDFENHAPAPMYDVPYVSYSGRDHSSSAPPIPAKIPLTTSAGAMVPMNRTNAYGEMGGQMSLMEEMSRIDIGTGRARRHHRPAIGGY